MATCPNCHIDVGQAPGTVASCPRCGQMVGEVAVPVAPELRRFREEVFPDRTRFRGKAGLGMVVIAIFLVALMAAIDIMIWVTDGPPALAMVFLAAPIPFIVLFVFALVHHSDVSVSRGGVEIRSFPLAGASAGTYPREVVADFGWSKSPGPKGGYVYEIKLALRDGRSLRVPLEVHGESECGFVVSRMRAALAVYS